MKFKLHWLGDKATEIVEGYSIADALTKAGYGGGALGALDYHEQIKTTYTLDELDTVIRKVVPHFFDTPEESLEYHASLGGRCLALMRAGEHLYFKAVDITESEHSILRQAFNDLQKGYFQFDQKEPS